jgi:hypothetical protein
MEKKRVVVLGYYIRGWLRFDRMQLHGRDIYSDDGTWARKAAKRSRGP